MESSRIKIYIGFITYGKLTAKYLPYFLPSLKRQTYKDCKILAIDNSESEDNENAAYIKNNFPKIELIWAGKNLGFAKAYNIMIRQAVKDGAEYFLALNPDMVLEFDMIEKIMKVVVSEEKIGAVAPKILRWDFENNLKTNQLDSFGLAVNQEHRFYDKKQGEVDDKSKQDAKEIFGFTGAATLLNLQALEDVAYANDQGKKEYFDELMFMYKEDGDLSYRLRLADWKIVLAPEAVAYHNRKAASIGETDIKIALNRRNKNRQVKKWSFLNQWILLLKLKNLPFPRGVRLATFWYQFKCLLFIIFFEPYLLKELIKVWQLRPEIKKRRQQLKVRVGIKEIEKFMDNL